MRLLRIFVMVVNAAAIAILLAIPIGRLFGFVEQQVITAEVFGWLMYFVPLIASVLGLWGILFFRPALIRPFVIIAMPGSFLMTFVSLFSSWKGPSNIAQIGIVATILLGLNVLVLWEPFKTLLESPAPESPEADGDR